jgi:hypothetical protein
MDYASAGHENGMLVFSKTGVALSVESGRLAEPLLDRLEAALAHACQILEVKLWSRAA